MKTPLKKPLALWQNPLSLFGALIALLATAFGLPMMIFDFFSPHSQVYLAVLIYLVLPFVAIVGVAIVLIGVFWERRSRRLHPEGKIHLWPKIDLNRPSHQGMVFAVSFGVVVILVLLSVTGYRAYHFSESVQFCGTTCHAVMKPEYVAYQHSPHAKVACVSCHVGPGAGWFVRSKLSGLYQVYALATDSYERPIPTPVKNMRPAQDTCEQCHWPGKYFGAQQKTASYYLSDEANTPWQVKMLMNIGGSSENGPAEGIHWHMNIAKEIAYIAGDEKRETIPWVRVIDKDGKATEYQSQENPLTAEQIAKGPLRRMDCLDCHNRPAHHFLPPDKALNVALQAEKLDASLPYLKREALRLMVAEYKTENEAKEAIRSELKAFYDKEYPDVAKAQAGAIERSAEEVARLYGIHFFPEMRADWRAYPNHAAHLNSDGCFRCHDGLHKSPEGKVITKDCNACHVILAQGNPAQFLNASLKEQPFQHPVDVGADVTEYKCSQCHTGTGGQ